MQNIKIELIQWLTTLEDAATIEKIVALRKSENSDWWAQVSDEERNSIEKGISDANDRKLKPHAEARKSYKKWL